MLRGLSLLAVLALVGCEKKNETPPPVDEPAIQVAVTDNERAEFKQAAATEITAENAAQEADKLMAEIEAELAEPLYDEEELD